MDHRAPARAVRASVADWRAWRNACLFGLNDRVAWLHKLQPAAFEPLRSGLDLGRGNLQWSLWFQLRRLRRLQWLASLNMLVEERPRAAVRVVAALGDHQLAACASGGHIVQP